MSDSKVAEQRGMLEDNLQALLAQERMGQYRCSDYLSKTSWKINVYDLLKKERLETDNHGDARIDEYCREQIVEWSFRVVDYFRIDREVVSLSLSLLDRFLATCHCDRATFKLAATTTLNLGVKLLHPCKLCDLGILSDLSRGEFSMGDVAEMEGHILKSLQWNLHPPTPIALSTLFLDCIVLDDNINLSGADIDDLHDISSFFTELALCDYYFIHLSPSEIAVVSIINALEGMFGHLNKYSLQILTAARGLGLYRNQDLSAVSHRLWELYERSEECALHNNYDPMEEEKISGPVDHVFTHKTQQEAGSNSPISVSVAPKSMPISDQELLCAMRSQHIRNGSW
jgi:Cyclin, N-terminal domain/Cyclin, C-terminal domain